MTSRLAQAAALEITPMSDKNSEKKKIYKPSPISGFPEWLPEVRIVEQQWLDHIRRVFESYGYCSIETPAVEELNVIAAKGEDVDKEIYVIERLHKEEGETKEARLALHFDQTVPFARYVAMNFNELVFPFKRYQMQKVWRGERPQMGRMREFYQCDIDVINPDGLPITFDAEVAEVMYEVLSGLDIGRVQLRISNRKILMGLLATMGIADPAPVTRVIDKIEKIRLEETQKSLTDLGLTQDQIKPVLELAQIKASPKDFSGLLRDFIARNDVIARSASDKAIQTFNEGIEELSIVMDALAHLPDGAAVADLSIVRGLDYYTGTVYETQLLDVPEFTGSVCSGGRYDDLAGSYINKHLPGVGISIGFSRLFDVMRQTGRIKTDRKSPTEILVMPPRDASAIKSAYETAQALRKQGWNVEVAPGKKFDKQMSYAEKKGIRYLWFVEDGEVQDRNTREKTKADPNTWRKT